MSSDQSHSNISDDAQTLHQERMQKLNLLMNHFGYKNSNNNSSNGSVPAVDSSSLLSAKDVEALRRKMLHLQEGSSPSNSNNNNGESNFFSHLINTQPDDSYIFAFSRWFYAAVRASVESGLDQTKQAHFNYMERRRIQDLVAADQKKKEAEMQEKLKQQQLKAAAEERAKMLAEQQRLKQKDDFPMSAEGRTLKLKLSAEEEVDLHPKVSQIRNEIMDMEKKIHDDLDRVLQTRLRFLTLSREEPPCLAEMKTVADCYAQFAAKKYQTATFLEKEAATPDVVKKYQKDDGKSKFSPASSKAGSFSSRKHPDLPEELLASEEVLKLSTSVLACRELAKNLEKCSLNAGLHHVEKNHGEN